MRETTSNLEEIDLWDIEGDEEEIGEPSPEIRQTVDNLEPTEIATETPKQEPEIEVPHKSPDLNGPLEKKIEPEEDTPRAQPTTTSLQSDSTSNAPEEPATDPIKKVSLSLIEKVSLGLIAISLLGLAVWGYMFLYKQNNLSNLETKLDLPVEGKFATISDFKTFWQNPEGLTGIKLGARIIPTASITLSEGENHSGAFRVYFINAKEESVGDTITITFDQGKFDNGKNIIEVSATDGFHREADFNGYILDESLAWRVRVLEADSVNASGSDFKQLLETTVDPIRE